MPVADYVKRVPAAFRPTLNAGRRSIKGCPPQRTREIAYRTWPIRYAVDGFLVCGIGKSMRHVKLRRPKDADSPALRRMLRRAFKMGGMDMRGRTAT